MKDLKSVYLQTYNCIYYRAKSILNKEEDILELMKEVYIQAAGEDISNENAMAWMGKKTYILGCSKFRKKKAREAEIIELQENEYVTQKGIDCDKTKEVICETLEELPDLYQATLFAFYYDQYSVKEVAAITGYDQGVVINRLNYIHKYLDKKLKDYQEDNKVKVQFSVEMVYEALNDWAAANGMNETAAQNLYASICRELDLPMENIFEDEVAATDNNRISEPEKLGVEVVKKELETYSVKTGMDKKQLAIIGAVIGGLAILVLIAILVFGNNDKKDEPKDNQQVTEENVDNEEPDVEDEGDVVIDEETEEEPPVVDEEDTTEVETEDSEYILPNSDTVRLTKSDLQGLSKEELRLARNEIFARHGMIFGVADLDAYFGAKSWYKPTVAYDDFYDVVDMSMIEEANLVLISQVEEEME